MHEYPITLRIIEIATEHARKHQAKKIKRISLVVGEKSGFLGESIQMYFDIASQGSLAEGAKLEIHTVKAKLRCPACEELFERKPYSFACPKCGQDGHPTEIGKEFYIKDLEIET